jgi:hypothetical protein
MVTLSRVVAATAAVLGLAACGERGPNAPAPTTYAWPDAFSYLVEFVSESRADTLVVARYEERKALRFQVRDDRFLVWHDSVVKESLEPGRPSAVAPLRPEDTLLFYVSLGRRGEIGAVEPGCDPAVPACREALPSSLPLELRRLVPALPVWEPPAGSTWEDTLVFDDTPRARGQRGSVVTVYRVVGDTAIAGNPMWIVSWRSIRRTFTPVPGFAGLAAGVPVEERGSVYVDQQRRLPVFAMWAGGAAVPGNLRSLGVTSTGYRGRAYLAGSVVEQVLSPE